MAQEEITPRLLLEHMQGMEQRINKRFDAVDQRFESVGARIDRLDHKLSTRLDRLENKLSTQIEHIDKRLDDIELEYLPKRVRRIERHLKLTAA